jgi:hypothetical protein
VQLSKTIRRGRNFFSVLSATTLLLACSSDADDGAATGGVGGDASTGGVAWPGTGGSAFAGGGAGPSSGGLASAGGMPAMGTTGGAGVGGAGVGGAGAGGSSSGGVFGTGGVGGTGSGGATGGTPGAGGASSGGTGPCEFPEPPADVAEWIAQSWNDQLGDNIRNRSAWNLDHVIYDQGEMNLCVRWGATSPVPEAVRTNLAATVERWFNDWFHGLRGYGCFPYGDGIKVKITGWAVRPGSESLLGGISSVPVYTETDGEGEPKCPDACSEFAHWDHRFPNCPGGAANHHDYWLWFDDRLPGPGNAAAVGGDWGLRMPVSTFVNAFDRPSYLVVEHEMGHGFGFQDYYEWTGARPAGGSIMIVGSTSGSQAPTTGDIWLLRRTWKEMKELRGW